MANNGLPPGATLVSGALPSQPADAAAADTSAAQPSTAAGLPPGATLVSGTVPPAAPASKEQSILGAVGDFAKGTAEGAVGGMADTISSLPWVGKHILSPDDMRLEREYFKPGSAAEKYGQTTGEIAEPILEFVLGDEALKGIALADKMGIASKIAKIAQDSPYIGKLLQHGVNAARMGTVGTTEALAKGATPTQAAKTGAVIGLGGEALSAGVDAVPAIARAVSDTASEYVSKLTNPFRKLFTSPTEAGVAATQEPAAAAIRTAVSAPDTIPIRAGTTTAVDDHLAKVGVAKDAAYKQIDDIAEFDLKAEKQHLKDTQRAIKQPGADTEKLQDEINVSTKAIADANAKLVKAGIDPKHADRLNTSWEAIKGIKNDIVKSTSSDGTVNVKKLLSRSANSRFNPRYGDRLAQAFGKGDVAVGKPIADAYIKGLEEAQAAGKQAIHAQRVHQWIAGLLGAAAVGGSATAGIKLLLEP